MNEIHPSAGPQNRTSSLLQHLPSKNLDLGGQSLNYLLAVPGPTPLSPTFWDPQNPLSSFFFTLFCKNAFFLAFPLVFSQFLTLLDRFVDSGSSGEPFGLAPRGVCCTSAFLQKKSQFPLPDLPLERFWEKKPPFFTLLGVPGASFWGPKIERNRSLRSTWSPRLPREGPEAAPGRLRGRFGSLRG